jgi:hypothetical protein
MSQYPERDNMGGAQFARLVRNEHEYWVEWVLSFPEDHYEEAITAVKHAPTPQLAMQYARDTIADFHAQIARGEYYTGYNDVSAKEANKLQPGYLDDPINLRFPLHVEGESPYMLVSFLVGTHTDIEASVREASLAGVAELSKQLDGIPELNSKRWMLIW